MGQINTNNYPTVDSLADADLLIVENAIHGTGTTTPKQLKEKAIGTDPLQTTAQTVTGAINELKYEIDSGTSFTLAGAGSEKNYSSGVVDTDIYLHRAPKIGDRFLISFVSTYTSPPSIKVYDEEGGTAYTLSFGQWSSAYKLSGICLLEVVDFLGDLALDFIYNFNGKEYQSGNGIAISGTTIRNTAMQKGDNAAYVEVDEPITSGNLGFGNGDARYLFVNFEVDVTPNDTTHLYYMFLTSGLAMGLAVLKDRDGNDFSKNLYAGMMLFCKRESGGSGTEGDPYILTVVSVFDWSVGDDGAIKAGGRVQDGEGNDLASVAALEVSASGNPIIVNAQPVDAKELSVELEPIQDLHGYDHPWAGGAGKNKLPLTVENIKAFNITGTWSGNAYTLNGVTFTIQTDADGNVTGIKANGTASANTSFSMYNSSNVPSNIKGQSIILTGCPVRTGNPYTVMLNSWGTASAIYDNGTEHGTATFPANPNGMRCDIETYNGSVLSNVMFYPMIRLSTESDASFSPYSNICPISGRTEASVNDHGKNLLNNTLETNTVSNHTFTVNDDKSITVTSTANASSQIVVYLNSDSYFKGNGQNMILTGCPSGGGSSEYGLQIYDVTAQAWHSTDYGSGVTFSTIDGHEYEVIIYIRSGKRIENKTFYPMVRFVDVADSIYEPYKSTSATISFGTTVYGGQVDFKTGRVRVDRQYQSVTLDSIYVRSGNVNCDYAIFVIDNAWGNFTEIENSFISDMMRWITSGENFDNISKSGVALVYSTGTKQLAVSVPKGYTIEQARALFANAHVCLALGSPIELTLTPSMLKLLEGYNYITGDGEMSMVYIPESVLGMPIPPTADGNYKLCCTVSGGVPVFSWVSDT